MVLRIITNASLLAFLIGITIRIWRTAAMPTHIRWELYPIPRGAAEKTLRMVSEVFLLEGVRNNHRALWLWSWLLHISLYLLIGTGCLSVAASILAGIPEGVLRMVSISAWAAFTGGIAATCGLIVMRLVHSRLRPMTSLRDIFALLLLLAIFLSGLAHALIQPSAAHIMVAQAGSFLWLNPAPPLHWSAVMHLCLISLLAASMPWTRMAHMVLKYFTYHSVRWDDRAADEIPGYRVRMGRYLAYPVRWSAPHIQSGKAKATWTDVIGADGIEERKLEKHPTQGHQ